MTIIRQEDIDMKRVLENLDTKPIPLLDKIRKEGRVWGDLCEQYGVDNPNPPWKAFLEGMCDALSEEACALPLLERRWEEDELSDATYADVPYPERQLLALAHSLIRRGLFDEQELANRMAVIQRRLTESEKYYADELGHDPAMM